MALLRQDVVAAGEAYSFLKSVRRGVNQTGVFCDDRILGLLSQAMGNLDQSMAHFADTLAFCRKAGYRPKPAWTCCD